MDTISSNKEPDHAGVYPLPPMVMFIMLLAGLGLDMLHPLPLGLGMVGTLIGMMLGMDAITLVVFTACLMKKAGTNVPPNRPTKLIISHGPFRFSRNPIYIGFTLAMAAFALLFDSGWLAGLLVMFFFYIDRHVIPREEAYLSRKFGQEYITYTTKVRRWI